MIEQKWNNKCLICNSEMEYYFSKEYVNEAYRAMLQDNYMVNYYKCVHCGFVISKTHVELTDKQWEKLNSDFHHNSEKRYAEKSNEDDFISSQPPFLFQALMISVLVKNNVIDISNSLDYAAGYGNLSKVLKKYFDLHLPIFDEYVKSQNLEYVTPNESNKYNTVVSSAFFEHIRCRCDIEKVNNLVKPDGALFIHTRIMETVPAKPDWFYIDIPVHCAFHTNKSMEILMKQWGYVSSLYSPDCRCWVLFKKEPEKILEKVALMNREFERKFFFYKKGFVDFWKNAVV